MKILFTKSKHYGKEVSECDSSYLVFLIESNFADWALIEACKVELSQRLKLDWSPPDKFEAKYRRAIKYITTLEKILCINQVSFFRNRRYISSPKLLDQDLILMKQVNQ